MSDLIDRQEAIDAANDWLLDCLKVEKQDRSCGLIRRLEDLPSAQPMQPNAPNTLDAISREEAMKICRRMVWNGADDYLPLSAKNIENEIRKLPSIKVCETEPSDLISRQAAIALADSLKDDLPDDERIADAVMAHNDGILEYQTALSLLPSAQPERLTDDDFETIRIHLNAYKEKLCNQRRWKEAEEYQRIIDRFMGFAQDTFYVQSQEPPKALLARMKNMQIEIIPIEEPKVKGKWIGGELGECSICGHEGCASDIWTGCEKTYCPNCGHELEGTGI